MRSYNGTVQQEIPHIRIIGKMLMQIGPYPMLTPPRKAFVDRIPVALVFRQQTPLRAVAQDPQNRFHELSAFGRLACIGSGMLL
jgi:hypothetical protein